MKTKVVHKEGVSNMFTVTMTGMTAGQIAAMQRALDTYGLESTVAKEVGISLFRGATEGVDLLLNISESRAKT